MRPEPLDPVKQPPSNRYCDLVLTGGVTDGVVYPWAVLELAREYRFKNIGGTSVGAMAAALTAAAEYRRRYGSLTGFNEVLLKVPERLGEAVYPDGTTRLGDRADRDCTTTMPGEKAASDCTTRIFSLFQPAKSTQRLFDLFVTLLSFGGESVHAAATAHTAGPSARIGAPSCTREQPVVGADGSGAKGAGLLRYLDTVARIYRVAGLLGGLLGLLGLVLALSFGFDALLALPGLRAAAVVLILVFLVTLPAMLLFGMALIVVWIYRDVMRGLVPNDFGLCTGGPVQGMPAARLSLVEWLHDGIQAAAGKAHNRPLTFEDLWDAPGGPNTKPPPSPRRKIPRSIDLRMITTNLTHGRPYEFPLDEDSGRLFFDPSEWKDFFPEPVLKHLAEHSLSYNDAPRSPEDPDPSDATRRLLELPKEKLPVVVAARLSLSLPFLFSALPLWAIDYEPKSRNDRKLRRCRFSDGGICSNFPIHMFDAAIPEWPTFGISLGPKSVFRKNEEVWVSSRHDEGRESWFRFDDERTPVEDTRVPQLHRLLGFVASIVYSGKDWNDKTAMRMPGVRDRVVHVALGTGVGGLNLKLSAKNIMDLAKNYGLPAGKALVGKFIEPARRVPSHKWDEHRWVRFHTFLVGLRERIELIRNATELPQYGKPLAAHIQEARQKRPLEGNDDAGKTLNDGQVRELQALLAALKDLEAKFANASLPQPYQPMPTPGLHIRAPL